MTQIAIDLLLGWPKSSFDFLSKNERHIFHFHQGLYWTTHSPPYSTIFCHFSGKFIIPSSQNFLSFWAKGYLRHLLFIFKFKFIYFNWRLITLHYCIGSATHQHESATGEHVPHPELSSHLPPCTIPRVILCVVFTISYRWWERQMWTHIEPMAGVFSRP